MKTTQSLRFVGRRVICQQQHDNDSEIIRPFNCNGVRERINTRYTRTGSTNDLKMGHYCAAYSAGRPESVIDVVRRQNTIRFINRLFICVHEWNVHGFMRGVFRRAWRVWRGTNFTNSQRRNNWILNYLTGTRNRLVKFWGYVKPFKRRVTTPFFKAVCP